MTGLGFFFSVGVWGELRCRFVDQAETLCDNGWGSLQHTREGGWLGVIWCFCMWVWVWVCIPGGGLSETYMSLVKIG